MNGVHWRVIAFDKDPEDTSGAMDRRVAQTEPQAVFFVDKFLREGRDFVQVERSTYIEEAR